MKTQTEGNKPEATAEARRVGLNVLVSLPHTWKHRNGRDGPGDFGCRWLGAHLWEIIEEEPIDPPFVMWITGRRCVHCGRTQTRRFGQINWSG